MQLFACRGNTILHTLNRQELPLELINTKPLAKFGYSVVVENTDGTLLTIEDYKDGMLTVKEQDQPIQLH